MSKPDLCVCPSMNKGCVRNRALTMPGQELSKLRANRERQQRMKQLKLKGRHARCLSLESLFPPSEFQVLFIFPDATTELTKLRSPVKGPALKGEALRKLQVVIGTCNLTPVTAHATSILRTMTLSGWVSPRTGFIWAEHALRDHFQSLLLMLGQGFIECG
ncbi:hypothetical protein RRG08_046230 [Elysia crispata]|uniref:Uncharacterized protein n=1 Tax=Elysia crispata TaxID=231223 RepID=A0AAE0YN14_9GAST|nr:hypothetical protein RRG08_046230 [Elysia crispata]